MTKSTEDQRATYPLPAYNYRVDIGGTTVSFARVDGLVVERAVATYKHGLSFREGDSIVQFDYERFLPLTFERGVIIGLEQLSEWIEAGDVRSVDVSLCDEIGTPVVTWHVANAVPVALRASAVDAQSSEVAVERLEVLASGTRVSHPGAA